MKSIRFFSFFYLAFGFYFQGQAQNLNAGLPILEEYLRREQLKGDFGKENSFHFRPMNFNTLKDSSKAWSNVRGIITGKDSRSTNTFDWSILPIVSTTEYNSKRPYGWGNKGLTPGVGFQTYLSAGLYAKAGFLEIQLQPEFTFSENRGFQGFERNSRRKINRDRFFFWNDGDNPERFTPNESKFWWGQSRIQVNVGGFALAASTENIWWGPGQFNSLIFSDNAQGFPHLSLQTNRPLKTFIGNFEGQIIMGRLENSFLDPSQDASLNEQFFQEFDDDWRYLNAITITYNPSFLPNLFMGFNRTFQQYNESKGNQFRDWFPIFEFFQKERFFENGNTVIFDSQGQDQQVSVNFRYLVPKALFEIYADFGRRDHAFNWREFILNPEHARAYQFGFQKLFPVQKPNRFIQIRGEITHQQESVNRYIRYRGLGGNQTWHTHSLARGFVNYGQTLGVGTGVGSNVQTLEVSMVERFDKIGLRLERLENHQDFFYRAYGQNDEKRPWVDLSLGLLFDKRWNNLLMSSRAQLIYSENYQYNSEGLSTGDFPSGQNLLSFFGKVSLIYSLSAK
ncbi:capsule assembly Wzi family protein [Algoriphagus sediminis]|uniref:Capsule assembly Wzi family protein n=1 Tax=Algoriphagus sediminis TaxID=3057113 RepID=A0ABT7YE03_9BACT|nr:capsule assembly Wzi family protein [Algoriphagus sediminis]MDN3204752.1 capsule assembly Wzi family protein [Algoriphagus sediminis]